MPILLLLKIGFSMWMIYDAYERRALQYWYFIILMPGGALIYFFLVKLRDTKLPAAASKLLERPISIDKLRYEANSCPSVHNKLCLAQGLYDRGEIKESYELFKEILKSESNNKSAVYGLGLTSRKLGLTKDSYDLFKKLIEIDYNYKDMDAALQLAEVAQITNNREEAIEFAKKISDKSQSLRHITRCAKIFRDLDSNVDWRTMLANSLQDYKNSPKHVKKLNRPDLKQAKLLLNSNQ